MDDMGPSAAILALALFSAQVAAQPSCPLGRVNDTAPGMCGAYADLEGNGVCDYSEASQSAIAAAATPPAPKPQVMALGGYDFANLSAAMILFYGLSFALYRGGRMSLNAHRLAWNVLLLFTFLVCAVLGVLLVLRINYGFVAPIPMNMLYWHVEAGIAMALISAFHISWHAEYYRGGIGRLLRPGAQAQTQGTGGKRRNAR
jgi:hypothetical protein